MDVSKTEESHNLHGASPSATRDEGLFGLRVVGTLKLASGLVLAAAAFGVFRLLNSDLGAALEHFVSRLHLDPENRLIHEPLVRLAGLDRRRLHALGIGTLFYASLHIVEGTGLLMRRLWAGYLTIIASASLLPLEIYEIARKPTAVRSSVLAVNVAIVIYLVIKLRREYRRREWAAEPSLGSDRV